MNGADKSSMFEREVMAALKEPETPESTFGAYVSHRLREFEPKKRKYLEHLITELFFDAEFDTDFFSNIE
jgi:hypothetical protein